MLNKLNALGVREVTILAMAIIALKSGWVTGMLPHEEHLWFIGQVAFIFGIGLLAQVVDARSFAPGTLVLVALGWAAQDTAPFHGLVSQTWLLQGLSVLAVAYILAQSGLDEHWGHFKKELWIVLAFALGAFLLTGLFFAGLLTVLGLAARDASIIAATQGATDPAATKAVMASCSRKIKSRVMLILNGEAALNDVAAAVVFMLFMEHAASYLHFYDGFVELAQFGGLVALGKQVIIGLGVGSVGFGLLVLLFDGELFASAIFSSKLSFAAALHQRAAGFARSIGSVGAFLLFMLLVPSLYAAADVAGGNGFVAVFVPCLVFGRFHKLEGTNAAFRIFVEGGAVKFVFLALGSLVLLDQFGAYALKGVLAGGALVVARVIAVYLISAVIRMRSPERMTWAEATVIAFTGARGAIPAVLMLIAKAHNMLDDEAFAVGMWSIVISIVSAQLFILFGATRIESVLEGEKRS